MTVAVITGSSGLVGSEAALHFARRGLDIVGVDNDMRRIFFGEEASTAWQRQRLERTLGPSYRHIDADVRDRDAIMRLVAALGNAVTLVIHAAAQPSHDWAAREPFTDFDINAVGTLNMLEATRRHAPEAAFIFCSTNKVYGDEPNRLPFVEETTRWEVDPAHSFHDGIAETMSVDRSLHSLFGASKLAADILVQEYGRYFDLPTACFRGGTLTGPAHSATELHGFLAYVVRCALTGQPYTIHGYKGKQVRDAIHSTDLLRAFERFADAPRIAEVYNIGGGRASNASVLEAIDITQEVTGKELSVTYSERNRVGDHIWWISDMSRFQQHYPGWRVERDIRMIIEDIVDSNSGRWTDA